ncbi:MAG: hypothetical protein Q7R81_04965 [Candidatus Peregrinibacteria bacterium]|nr:hypothetical protein [Candidatus Peregrinibacteria bacterium]
MEPSDPAESPDHLDALKRLVEHARSSKAGGEPVDPQQTAELLIASMVSEQRHFPPRFGGRVSVLQHFVHGNLFVPRDHARGIAAHAGEKLIDGIAASSDWKNALYPILRQLQRYTNSLPLQSGEKDSIVQTMKHLTTSIAAPGNRDDDLPNILQQLVGQFVELERVEVRRRASDSMGEGCISPSP